jgi:hypothetical protein
MWLKTALKRLWKFLPKNEKVNKALDFDLQSEENIREFQKRKALEEAQKPSSNTIAWLIDNEISKDTPNVEKVWE